MGKKRLFFDRVQYPSICSAIEQDESGRLREELENWALSQPSSPHILSDPSAPTDDRELEYMLDEMPVDRIIRVSVPVLVYGGGSPHQVRARARPYWTACDGREHTFLGDPAPEDRGRPWYMYRLNHLLTVPQAGDGRR